jgi:excinuclease ABC subunit B
VSVKCGLAHYVPYCFINGKVIFYANKITRSMKAAMDETERRRGVQMAFNTLHSIVPKGITKSVKAMHDAAKNLAV